MKKNLPTKTSLFSIGLAALSFLAVTASTRAQTLCVETNGVKYLQSPNPSGYDVWNSGAWVLADDFVCTSTGPITDIHIWGSWLGDLHGTITNFWLGIYDDVPVNSVNPNSHPGNLLWSESFPVGQFAESSVGPSQEQFLDPGPGAIIGSDTQIWYYCFYPTNPFVQTGSNPAPKIYWLAAYAQVSGVAGANFQYGWKTTFLVQNDISVHEPWTGSLPGTNSSWLPTAYLPPAGGQVPLDLAFMLNTPTNNDCIIPITCSVDKTVACGTAWTFDPPTVGQSPCCPNPTVQFSAVTNSFNCTNIFTGTWTILDCSGKIVGVCTQNVTVIIPPPVMYCTTNKTVACGSAWNFDPPSAVDPCSGSGASIPVTIVSTVTNAPSQCQQTFTRIWSATNSCGEFGTCTQTVTVAAINPPIMNCPTNKTVINGSAWTFDTPTAVDACSGQALVVAVLNTVTNGQAPCNEIFTRTWQAVDACNNTNSCSQTVTNMCLPVVCVESDYEKYVQGPNTFGGYDVMNTIDVLADDFICNNTGPISDIHLWGSWLGDQAQTNSLTFWLGIYDDVPVGPNNTFSHPGTNLLWQQWFAPGQYAEMQYGPAQESFLDPNPPAIIGSDSVVWYYCFYPTNAFQQTGTAAAPKTYWLAAYATNSSPFTGGPTFYGWKSTTNVTQDVSVHAPWPGFAPTNNPGWTKTQIPSTGGPLDLAFKLTMCSPVTINRLAPTNVIVTWAGGGHLQSATNVAGPYVDVPGAPISPYIDWTISPTNKFYRLRCY